MIFNIFTGDFTYVAYSYIKFRLMNNHIFSWYFIAEHSVATINSKINGTSKDFYAPILKLRSILAIVNLLVHSNLLLCHYGQVAKFAMAKIE